MASTADLVRRTERHLAEHGVSAGLGDLVAHLETAPDGVDPALARQVRERGEALGTARAAVLTLGRRLDHLRRVHPWTEDGWPLARERLRTAHDETSALTAWLDFFFAALAAARTTALERLLADVSLPPGAEPVADLARLATHGLAARDWTLVRPVLVLGARGLPLGDGVLPPPEVARSLRFLGVRLALHGGWLDDAAVLLDEDAALPDDDPGAGAGALRARWLRLRGEPERAREVLFRARAQRPSDLDVVLELIAREPASTEVKATVEIARVGVDGLESLVDVDHDLGALVEPSPQLWLAVAGRAGTEGDPELARHALDVAEGLTGDLPRVGAVVAERQAERATDPHEVARALVRAGERRLDANQVPKARRAFERARRLEVDDPALRASVMIRRADTVAVLAASRPLTVVRDEVSVALDELRAAGELTDLLGAESWHLMVEVHLRHNLARTAAPSRVTELWLALLAAARAVACDPGDARRWTTAAAAVQELDCFHVSELWATHAVTLAPDDPVVAQSLAQARANLGAVDAAFAGLEEDSDEPWEQAVRGYLLLRQGRPEAAVQALSVVEIDPTWGWAHDTLIDALILTDRLEEARARAREMRDALADWVGERSTLAATVFAVMVSESPAEGLDAAADLEAADAGLNEGEGSSLRGALLLLTGEPDAGIDALVRAVGQYQARNLDDWGRVERPRLLALARARGIELDMRPIDAAVTSRRAELAATDPEDELDRVTSEGAAAPVARVARWFAAALVDVARGRHDEPPDPPDDAAERYAVELAGLAAHRTRSRWAAVLRAERDAAVDRLSDGDPVGALAVLDRLAPDVSAATLFAVGPDPIGADGVTSLASALLASPESAGAAARVLDWVRASFPEPEAGTQALPLRLELPSTWFDDCDDPVTEHEIFTEHLPALRVLAEGDLPAVRVRAQDDLEPDGFRVLVDDVPVGTGTLDPGARYCREATTALLPATARASATPAGPGDWWCLPGTAGTEDAALLLLTTSAAGLAVWLVGQAYLGADLAVGAGAS